MSSRTQILCLHEGTRGRSIDPVFINRLMRTLKPSWVRPWGSNVIRLQACGGRSELIARMPGELQTCLAMSSVALMVWADLDHDMPDGDALRREFWAVATQSGIAREEFEQVVFVFAKDRLENWIEFLLTKRTDESKEAPRQKHNSRVADAAKELARQCLKGVAEAQFPPSLAWSCRNWRALRERMAK